MPETLRDIIEHASATAEKIMAQEGKLSAHWYVLTRNGERAVIPAPPYGKNVTALIIRGALSAMDAVKVVFVDEAWSILAKTDEQEAAVTKWIETHGNLGDYPGRTECVCFEGEEENGPTLTGRRALIRKNGKVKLGPLEVSMPRSTAGRMTGWLPPRGTKQ